MYLEKAAGLYKSYPSDITKLAEHFLRKEDEHYKTYVFDALPWIPPDARPEQREKRERKRRYLEALRYQERIVVEEGYVKPKPTICPNCHNQNIVPVQKKVDVLISVRLVSLAWSKSVDKLLLIAGDSDLVPAVEDVEPSGRIVRLVYLKTPEVGTSDLLIKACPEKQQMTPQDLMYLKYSKPFPPR
jgi:uncharacterized LabA/DUF88 family protein